MVTNVSGKENRLSFLNIERKSFNVKERKLPRLTYTCDCTKFQQLDGVCSHVMAVAERKGSLSRVLEYYQQQGANTNKIMCS